MVAFLPAQLSDIWSCSWRELIGVGLRSFIIATWGKDSKKTKRELSPKEFFWICKGHCGGTNLTLSVSLLAINFNLSAKFSNY